MSPARKIEHSGTTTRFRRGTRTWHYVFRLQRVRYRRQGRNRLVGRPAESGGYQAENVGRLRSDSVVLKLPHVTRVVTRPRFSPPTGAAIARTRVRDRSEDIRRTNIRKGRSGILDSVRAIVQREKRGREGAKRPFASVHVHTRTRVRAHAHVVYARAHDLTNNRSCPAASRGETENAALGMEKSIFESTPGFTRIISEEKIADTSDTFRDILDISFVDCAVTAAKRDAYIYI